MIFSIEEKRALSPALRAADGTEVTYGELRDHIKRLGETFGGRCLVFCLCENTPEAVIGYLGAVENGAVPLLLGSDLNMEQFDRLFHVYGPSFIWAGAEWEEKLAGRVCDKVCEIGGYSLWRTGQQPCPMHPELTLLLATSGSTGSPKLVRLSRRNIEANAASICRYLELDETERPITTLPMQYTYGLSVINSHLLAGACILMTRESYVQNGFWEFFAREGVTSLSGVPYTYEILKRMRIFKGRLPSLRCLTQAGGRLPADLQREVGLWARENGVRFFVMYGQTEATARMSYLPPEDCLNKPGSIGVPVPGGRFWIRDGEQKPVKEPKTSGELIYEGPNVSLGYARSREDLRLGDVNGGVLCTGDLAMFDEDGYYYVTGRKSRFVKIYGVRVSLDACERMLRGRWPQAEFACAGTDNCLRIFTTDQKAASCAADWLADALRLNGKGFSCRYLPKLPKSGAGKILYAALAETVRGPFSMGQKEKEIRMTRALCELTRHHRDCCPPYAAMLRALGYREEQVDHYRDLPFLPVTLFKKLTLSSLPEGQEEYKVATSSGTGGQPRSKIILDADTRTAQQQALAEIGSDFLGTKRLPLLVIDCPSMAARDGTFSARTAGIRGFSLFGSRRVFALGDDMTLNVPRVTEFLEKYGQSPFLIFGFTFMVWQHFCREQERRGISFACENGVLIHGGGWKKLQAESVSKREFKERLRKICGIRRVIDYYGMAEQTGSIFMECECGHLHCSDYSAVLFRRPQDFSLCDVGETGLIQVMSVLPKSYPGHSLLTEDEGRLLGVDDCPCGRMGEYFEVTGRVKNAELRGCSDTYAAREEGQP